LSKKSVDKFIGDVEQGKKFKVNTDPRLGELELDPNCQLTCMWCNKMYFPYEQVVSDGYYFMGFCTPECAYTYQTRWGKFIRKLRDMRCWLYRNVYDPIEQVYRYRDRIICPHCHIRATWMTEDLQMCENTKCESFPSAYWFSEKYHVWMTDDDEEKVETLLQFEKKTGKRIISPAFDLRTEENVEL